MNAGFIFSLCAGVLIGLRMHYGKKTPRPVVCKRAKAFLKDLWYGS